MPKVKKAKPQEGIDVTLLQSIHPDGREIAIAIPHQHQGEGKGAQIQFVRPVRPDDIGAPMLSHISNDQLITGFWLSAEAFVALRDLMNKVDIAAEEEGYAEG